MEGYDSARVGIYVSLIITWLAVVMVPIVIWVPDNSRWDMALAAAIVGLLFAAFAIAGSTFFSYWAARHSFYERVRAEKSYQIENDMEALRSQGSRRLSLADLFVINRRQLDEYHVTSLHEQRAAFRNAQIAAAIGFILLAAGVALVVENNDSSARYAAAGLTGVASILSGFISSIFFKSYTDTTRELRHYYWEPLRTGQVLAVERLAGIDIRQSTRGADDELRRALAQKMMEQLPEIPLSAEPGGLKAGAQGREGEPDGKRQGAHSGVLRRKHHEAG
ncbi:hypothetical protein [Streptomyces sp. NPDC051452]|uniref:TRADD-N-associated membrane domain-containing protein n=1 Tax=Streptomyces sp. NPDC051452 TaxID=3365654 RepID=UPI00378C3E7A